MKKIAWFLIPFVLAALACVKADQTEMSAEDYPQAPDFTLDDLSGNAITLSSLKGKVVFLNFWATWCGPCIREIPDFIEIYKEYKDKGLEIIGVSVDNTGSEKVEKFVKNHEIDYPVAMYTTQFIRDYTPGNAIPVTIIIDPQGRIRHKKIGITNKSYLEDWFLKLTEEK